MKETLPTSERYDNMRGWFAYEVYNQMAENEDIYLIVVDLGYAMWDRVKADFPDRFINTGAAEQAAMGIAVGLAEVYSITNFLLYRPFETIRNYVNYEEIAVKLVGSGRDRDYAHDGISHWSEDARALLDSTLPNIEQRWPETKEEIPTLVKEMIETQKPYFISLRR